jgi:hypothetical protein
MQSGKREEKPFNGSGIIKMLERDFRLSFFSPKRDSSFTYA